MEDDLIEVDEVTGTDESPPPTRPGQACHGVHRSSKNPPKTSKSIKKASKKGMRNDQKHIEEPPKRLVLPALFERYRHRGVAGLRELAGLAAENGTARADARATCLAARRPGPEIQARRSVLAPAEWREAWDVQRVRA